MIVKFHREFLVNVVWGASVLAAVAYAAVGFVRVGLGAITIVKPKRVTRSRPAA